MVEARPISIDWPSREYQRVIGWNDNHLCEIVVFDDPLPGLGSNVENDTHEVDDEQQKYENKEQILNDLELVSLQFESAGISDFE